MNIAISTSLVVSFLPPPCRQLRLSQIAVISDATKTLNAVSTGFVEEERWLLATQRTNHIVCLPIVRLVTKFVCLRRRMVFVVIL